VRDGRVARDVRVDELARSRRLLEQLLDVQPTRQVDRRAPHLVGEHLKRERDVHALARGKLVAFDAADGLARGKDGRRRPHAHQLPADARLEPAREPVGRRERRRDALQQLVDRMAATGGVARRRRG